MRRQLFLPPEVVAALKEHIDASVSRAVEAFPSGEEDEDTLTGQLGLALKIGEQTVNVSGEVSGVWRWSIDYTKFRSHGQGATEKVIGADGIVELRLNHGQGEERKTALFQAKKNWRNDPALVAQSIRLSTWKEAAF